MDTARVRSIASLGRGLEVLSLLHARDGVQLRELHEASGVPKASLLRVLKTLIEHRWVRRRAADGAYLASVLPQVPAQRDAQSAAASRPLAAEVLAGALRDLRQTLTWPSDVAVRHGGVMRVIDSNRSAYGRVWRPSVVGEDVDMLESAMGRAYLAFSSQEVSRALIDMLLAPGGTRARRRELLERELLDTRRRGFGARDRLYAGPDSHHGRQLSAIALPILVNEQVIACVSCVWSTGLASHAEVVEQSLVHLARCAQQASGLLGHRSAMSAGGP